MAKKQSSQDWADDYLEALEIEEEVQNYKEFLAQQEEEFARLKKEEEETKVSSNSEEEGK